jgi:sugar/nucleoside kinase (ribokinase family)
VELSEGAGDALRAAALRAMAKSAVNAFDVHDAPDVAGAHDPSRSLGEACDNDSACAAASTLVPCGEPG